jgi:hypothetical protein
MNSSLSFVGYNSTHLWSMRLADEKHAQLVRQFPCRAVEYSTGIKSEKIDMCDPSTINEFSVESTLQAQKWLYEYQHPVDCTKRKIAIIHQFASSGFGSTVHQIVWAFGVAIAEDRIAVYQTPGNWVRRSSSVVSSRCAVERSIARRSLVRSSARFTFRCSSTGAVRWVRLIVFSFPSAIVQCRRMSTGNV